MVNNDSIKVPQTLRINVAVMSNILSDCFLQSIKSKSVKYVSHEDSC